jgi:hypothetical protein
MHCAIIFFIVGSPDKGLISEKWEASQSAFMEERTRA